MKITPEYPGSPSDKRQKARDGEWATFEMFSPNSLSAAAARSSSSTLMTDRAESRCRDALL